MPLDAHHFAAELAPKLIELLEARKSAIIDDAGGLPRRAAVRLAWPTLVGEVPQLTETVIELLAWRFGELTVNNLVEALDAIRSRAAHRP